MFWVLHREQHEGGWRDDLEGWLAPFVAALGHKMRGRICPAYVAALIGPGDRKSVQPMRGLVFGQLRQLHQHRIRRVEHHGARQRCRVRVSVCTKLPHGDGPLCATRSASM